jgi:hypothetical protein
MTSKQELELFGVEDTFLDDLQGEMTGLIVGIAWQTGKPSRRGWTGCA